MFYFCQVYRVNETSRLELDYRSSSRINDKNYTRRKEAKRKQDRIVHYVLLAMTDAGLFLDRIFVGVFHIISGAGNLYHNVHPKYIRNDVVIPTCVLVNDE